MVNNYARFAIFGPRICICNGRHARNTNFVLSGRTAGRQYLTTSISKKKVACLRTGMKLTNQIYSPSSLYNSFQYVLPVADVC